MPTNVAKTTPRCCARAALLLTAPRHFLNSPPEIRKNGGQIDLKFNDYHSDPMDISATFWLLDITDWWQRQEETHSKYANLSNVVHNIISIIPHGAGVEAKFSLLQHVIGWRQSKTTGETLREQAVVWRFARANSVLLGAYTP
jgi:hypothetical protein